MAKDRPKKRIAAARFDAERDSLLMQAPIATAVITGPNHVYQLANPRYCEMVGRTDLVGKAYVEAFPELAGSAVLGVLDRVYRTGEPFSADEYPVMLDRGAGLVEVFYKFNLEPMRDDDGRTVGMMAVAIDVTSLVLARRAIEATEADRERLLAAEREARARAEDSQRMFRMLVESIPQLAWTANPDGWIDFYNEGWYRYTGTTLEEMEGWGWESVHDPDDLPRIKKGWIESLEKGEAFDMEFRLRGADGVLRWFLTRAVPVRDDTGRIVRWFGTNTNIDELKQVRADLESASRAKDEFLAMLGHELRNPLSPILTALQLMRLRSPDAATRERNVIERQVDHMARLVDDLLDVSRITRGKIELRKVTLELAEIVARAIEISSPLLEQKRQHLDVAVAARGLVVDVDPDRFAQVVSNLLTNAAKYSDAGARVAIGAVRRGQRIVLTVRDEGVGIEPEMLPTIFDRFVQEQQSIDRSLGGLGLGLAIVKSLVALHDGTVTAVSEGRGKGSVFEISIPCSATTAAATATATPGQVPARDRNDDGAPRGVRILVVDDNRDAADLLAESLELGGHRVDTRYDPVAALKFLEQETVDLALLDIGLPVMDGFELAGRIRANARASSTRLAAITGYGRSADLERSKAAGFDFHLVKPVEPEKIEALIRTIFPPPSPPR